MKIKNNMHNMLGLGLLFVTTQVCADATYVGTTQRAFDYFNPGSARSFIPGLDMPAPIIGNSLRHHINRNQPLPVEEPSFFAPLATFLSMQPVQNQTNRSQPPKTYPWAIQNSPNYSYREPTQYPTLPGLQNFIGYRPPVFQQPASQQLNTSSSWWSQGPAWAPDRVLPPTVSILPNFFQPQPSDQLSLPATTIINPKSNSLFEALFDPKHYFSGEPDSEPEPH